MIANYPEKRAMLRVMNIKLGAYLSLQRVDRIIYVGDGHFISLSVNGVVWDIYVDFAARDNSEWSVYLVAPFIITSATVDADRFLITGDNDSYIKIVPRFNKYIEYLVYVCGNGVTI